MTPVAEKNAARKYWLDKWHVSPSTNRDYDFIDGLRGIAILMVIVGHHFYINPRSGGLVRYIGSLLGTGGYGVTLFYTLSGFLISWPFWKRKIAGHQSSMPSGYFQRRFWKIYPPLALSLLLLTPLYILVTADWSFLSTSIQWLTGYAFWFPVSGKLNPVMWTLAIEVQFYVTLPAVFLCFKRVSAKASLVIIPALFFVVPIVVRLVTKKAPTFYPDVDTHYPAAMDAFCLGILVAGLENMGLVRKSWVTVAFLGVALWPLTMLIAATLSLNSAPSTMLGVEALQWSIKLSAACLLLFIAQPRHPIAQFICTPWLRWCGIISYEWYLLHQPFAEWSRIYFGPAQGNLIEYLLVVGIPLVTILIFSAAIYRFFSLPILRYGRGKNKH